MAYRRPGVTVTQLFVGLAPALAALALPSVVVGPAYQLVDGDSLGAYAAADTAYPYAGLIAGGAVDTAVADPNEKFPATKKPIAVTLKQTYVQILAAQTTGAWDGTNFTDATSTQFANVLPGDLIVIVDAPGLTIIAAQTNGASTNASGQRNRLTAGTVGQFANVRVGDSVIVTGGTNTTNGTYTVTAKSGDVLILSGNVNDGVGTSTNVAYSITGDRGADAVGSYAVKTVTDNNTLALRTPLPSVEAPLHYSVKRLVPGTVTTAAGVVVLPRLAVAGPTGFTADGTAISLPAVLQTTIGVTTYTIISANVFADYRALRNDMAATVENYTSPTDIVAAFGVGQVSPANPLAYGLQFMLENTVTSVNALGLDANAVTNEVLSYTNAGDVLGMTDMYAIAVLTQNGAVHQLMKTHVVGFSDPEFKKERVVLINSALITKAVLQAEQTTVLTVNNSRVVVNTQLDGSATSGTPTHLNDPTTNAFTAVRPGDLVVIQAGTNSVPGNYTVVSKTDVNNLVLSGSIITSGTSTDFQYYIVRQDGLGADGQDFYDRNGAFLSDGVATGHFLTIESGALAGRYKIGAVLSDHELTLAAAVPGVATLKTAIDYQVDRDLSKTEQATLVGGYSAAFASRRVVHCWPDVIQVPSGQDLVDVPGFYLGCAVAALTTGLPTQQGFTNLSIAGALGELHASGYFSDAQMNIIADGGTMIFAQDGPQQPLFCRHELTTDRSAIKFQEYQVTKNVDFIAKFTRDAFKHFPGVYNIVDPAIDDMKTTAQGVIKFLKDDTQRPKIGGVIKSGTLAAITEDPNEIDRVTMRFNHNIPIPLNNLDIFIQV